MVDKTCNQQVLGGLMQHPQYFSEIDKYNLSLSDFSTRFERYIFSALQGLYYSGAKQINPIDVVNYLKADAVATSTFESQNGIEYLQDLQDFTSPDNFDYYYSKLKKLNLLRDLKKSGFDTSQFYEENLVDPKALDINKKFESLTCNDITSTLKSKLLRLESAYTKSEENETRSAADGLDDLVANLKEGEDLGLSIQGDILNQVLGGARRGTMTVRSSGSGIGKTRGAVADACHLAYPIHYDSSTGKWIIDGYNEKVLLIITEQSFEEVQKMVLAYISDINEGRFRYGDFSPEENDVLFQSIKLIKQFKDNLTILRMPEPTVEGLKAMVREQYVLKDIGYLFMDYIFVSPSLLREFKDFHLRNDEALLLLSTALKDLAVELNICVFTSTQVNANADNNIGIRNESSIAGARSIINKSDNGLIMSRPTKDETDLLRPLFESKGLPEPNLVSDVFKVRSGQWTQVKIWSYMNLGTMKRKDLFITDANLNALQDFHLYTSARVLNFEDEEFKGLNQIVERLNSHD